MFKAIYMHTKPLKHTKNIEILTNYIEKTGCFKTSYKNQHFEALFKNRRSHNLRKRCASMPRTILKNKFLLKWLKSACFAIFTFVFFAFYDFFIQIGNSHVNSHSLWPCQRPAASSARALQGRIASNLHAY